MYQFVFSVVHTKQKSPSPSSILRLLLFFSFLVFDFRLLSVLKGIKQAERQVIDCVPFFQKFSLFPFLLRETKGMDGLRPERRYV